MNFIQTCESVFNEINDLRDKLRKGKMAPENYALQMGGIAQLEKQQKLMIAGLALEQKIKSVIPVNLIPLQKPEDEKVICLDQNERVITRDECLEYSGEHTGTCSSCKEFNILMFINE